MSLDHIGQTAISHITAGGALLAVLFLAGSRVVPYLLT